MDLGKLNAKDWGSIAGVAGKGADMVSNLLPQPNEYSGDKGAITQGMDQAYDKIADIAGHFGPYGQIVSGAMKVNALAGKGVKAIGGGTDGMTTADAILGSSFMQMTPLGMINGFGGKKTDTITKDTEAFATVGSSYGGTSETVNNAVANSGKKYGLFSSGSRKKMNNFINQMGKQQNIMSDIAESTTMNNDMLANQTSIQAFGSTQESAGGYDMAATRAAKQGMKFSRKQINMAIRLAKQGSIIQKPFIVNWDCLDEIPKAQEGIKLPISELTDEEKLNIINLVNQSKANFVNRLKDENRRYLDLGDGIIGSHKLNSALVGIDGKDTPIIYPGIQEIDGDLIDLTQSPYEENYAQDNAIKNKDIVIMPSIQAAEWFANDNYKAYYPGLQKYAPQFLQEVLPGAQTDTKALDNFNIISTIGDRVEVDGKTYIDDGQDSKGHRFLDLKGNLFYFKEGGSMNVIPEGALHAHKHHMENDENITKKGIPVVVEGEGGELNQQAEIERNEIIFRLEVTKKLEELNKIYQSEDSSQKEKDEAAIEAGKLLTDEILNNTDDRTGLLEEVQ